jgi:predicted aspartyl protease
VIRYRYLTQVKPPAPFIYVTLRNPQTGVELHDLPAQLDTAADRTVLPVGLVQALGLSQVGSIPIAGLGNVVKLRPSYLVEVRIHNLAAHTIVVVSDPDEVWILLGRDLLNNHRIILDGPQLALEIS